MSTLTPKAIRNLSIVVALVLAPVLSYGSAYLLYKQIDTAANNTPNKQLVKASVEEKSSLPQDLIDQISLAIETAEKRG